MSLPSKQRILTPLLASLILILATCQIIELATNEALVYTMLSTVETQLGEEESRKLETEAIVVATGLVDECMATRLRHLVETGQTYEENGPTRDIWVLHSHHMYNVTDPQRQQSEQLIQNITGLKSACQNPEKIKRFDSRRSGSSKSSFLQLVVENEYRYAWHLEDDMFYTGPWGKFFDSTLDSSTDVIPVNYFNQKDKAWWWKKTGRNCTINGTYCQYIAQMHTGWMAIRVSYAFAKSLRHALLTGEAHGHHEAIVGAYSEYANFTSQPLNPNLVGVVGFGGYGKWTRLNPANETSKLEHHDPLPSRLYHPVKCKAYKNDPPGVIGEVLAEWTTKRQRIVNPANMSFADNRLPK